MAQLLKGADDAEDVPAPVVLQQIGDSASSTGSASLALNNFVVKGENTAVTTAAIVNLGARPDANQHGDGDAAVEGDGDDMEVDDDCMQDCLLETILKTGDRANSREATAPRPSTVADPARNPKAKATPKATPKAGRAKAKAKTAAASGGAPAAASSQPTGPNLTVQPDQAAAPVMVCSKTILLSIAKSKVTDDAHAIAIGPGKKSPEDLVKADDFFLQTTAVNLLDIFEVDDMPTENDDELCKHGKTMLKNISELKAKIQAKLTALKRRKPCPTETVATLDSFFATCIMFQAIYQEFSAVYSNAAELEKSMAKAEQHGFTFTAVAQVKRCRGVCMESAKFGKYHDLAALFSVGEHVAIRLPSDSDVDRVFLHVCGRLLRAIPPCQTTSTFSPKAVLELPAASNFRQMIDAVHKWENLALTPGMQCQIAKVRAAISFADPSLLPADSLAACEHIQAAASGEGSSKQPLFATMASLPESAGFLAAGSANSKDQRCSPRSARSVQVWKATTRRLTWTWTACLLTSKLWRSS